MTKLSSVNDVLALFEKYGEEFYGEDVTQNAHALQTAAFAALLGREDLLRLDALPSRPGDPLRLEGMLSLYLGLQLLPAD